VIRGQFEALADRQLVASAWIVAGAALTALGWVQAAEQERDVFAAGALDHAEDTGGTPLLASGGSVRRRGPRLQPEGLGN
jgi:hypothetical protein